MTNSIGCGSKFRAKVGRKFSDISHGDPFRVFVLFWVQVLSGWVQVLSGWVQVLSGWVLVLSGWVLVLSGWVLVLS